MDRFWAKTQPRDSGCIEWTASCDPGGYGKFRVTGQLVSAHRFAYALTHGPIPTGAVICHRCDNPPCVNPGHLFVGTYADNAQDMIRKGRHWIVTDPGRRATGEAAHRARLTQAEVQAVIALSAQGFTQRAIAERVGTVQSHVSRILSGHSRPDAKVG